MPRGIKGWFALNLIHNCGVIHMAEKIVRKLISFDMEDPEQKKIYKILDKARYSQSKLILKLIAEFFNQYGITEDTSYDKVKTVVHLYLLNEDMTGIKEQKVNPVPTQQSDLTAALMSMLTQQQLMMGNMMMGNANGFQTNNIPSQQVIPSATTPIENPIAKETVEQSFNTNANTVKSNPSSNFSDLDDEEDDDSDLLNVASCFKAMM